MQVGMIVLERVGANAVCRLMRDRHEGVGCRWVRERPAPERVSIAFGGYWERTQ